MVSPRLIWLIRRALPTHYWCIAYSYTRLNRLSGNKASWACSMGLRCMIWQFPSHILHYFANKTIFPIKTLHFRANSITLDVLKKFPMGILWQWGAQVASEGLLMGSGSPGGPVLVEYSLMGVTTRWWHCLTDSSLRSSITSLQDPSRTSGGLVTLLPI